MSCSVSGVEDSSGVESESSLAVTLVVRQEDEEKCLSFQFLHPEFHAAWLADLQHSVRDASRLARSGTTNIDDIFEELEPPGPE